MTLNQQHHLLQQQQHHHQEHPASSSFQTQLQPQTHPQAQTHASMASCFASGQATGFDQSPASSSLHPSPNSNPNPSSSNTISFSSAQKTGSATRTGKRKSRATNKPPIKIFSADAENFMAMVQKLTGIPSETYNLFASPHALLPIQPPNLRMQGLPTLDTSTLFLGNKSSASRPNNPLLNNLPQFSSFQPSVGHLDSSQQHSFAPKFAGNTGVQSIDSNNFQPIPSDSKYKSLLSNYPSNLGTDSLSYSWDSLEQEKLKQEAFSEQLITGHGMLPMGVFGKGDENPSNDSILSGLTKSIARDVPSLEQLQQRSQSLPSLGSHMNLPTSRAS